MGGKGSFNSAPTYNYVGEGAGGYEKAEILTYRLGGLRAECIGVLLIVLAVVFFVWFMVQKHRLVLPGSSSSAELSALSCSGCLRSCPYVVSNDCAACTSGVLPSPGICNQASKCAKDKIATECTTCSHACGSTSVALGIEPSGPVCYVGGDPDVHIMTFGRAHVDFNTPGDYWIVKSSTVWIQGRYQMSQKSKGVSVLKAIAIGGRLIEKHRLIIDATGATFDGQPILMGYPSRFHNALVNVVVDSQTTVLQNGTALTPLRVVRIRLPTNVNVEVNRWTDTSQGSHINVKVHMAQQAGQEGQCVAWSADGKTVVPVAELMFPIITE